jgi:hypothetical protein
MGLIYHTLTGKSINLARLDTEASCQAERLWKLRQLIMAQRANRIDARRTRCGVERSKY